MTWTHFRHIGAISLAVALVVVVVTLFGPALVRWIYRNYFKGTRNG